MFVCLTLTRPVVAGKTVMEQQARPSASEMDDIKSDNVDSGDANLSVESKSVDVSTWSDVSEVPKKTMVSAGCGTSFLQEDFNQKTDDNEKKVVSTSTGTSPPPQSISTQVCVLFYY